MDALVTRNAVVETSREPYAAAQQKLTGQPLALQLVCEPIFFFLRITCVNFIFIFLPFSLYTFSVFFFAISVLLSIQLETRLPLGLHVNTVTCNGATRLAAPFGGEFLPSMGALKGCYKLEVNKKCLPSNKITMHLLSSPKNDLASRFQSPLFACLRFDVCKFMKFDTFQAHPNGGVLLTCSKTSESYPPPTKNSATAAVSK